MTWGSKRWHRPHSCGRLSSVVDVMVNDAFGCAHRNSPSITGFTDVLPCIAGLLMERDPDPEAHHE